MPGGYRGQPVIYQRGVRKARRAPYQRRRMSRKLQLSGSRSLMGALSRVHSFKRVGQPLYIANSNAAGYITSGNTDMIQAGSIGSSAGALTGTYQILGGMRFCLNHASEVNDITNLFDNYRITRIKLTFMFTANNAPGQALVGFAAGTPVNVGALPIINYCYDPDDDSKPLTREAVLSNGFCATRRLDNMFTVTITPRAQNTVVGAVGGVGGGLMPVGSWLDSRSTQIYMYGLKFCIDNWPQLTAAADSSIALVVTPTFYVEGKNVV